MNKSIKGSLVTGLLVMCLMSNVYATDSNKIINKSVLGSEESTFVSSIQKEVEENNVKYKLSDYSKQDDEQNSKIRINKTIWKNCMEENIFIIILKKLKINMEK